MGQLDRRGFLRAAAGLPLAAGVNATLQPSRAQARTTIDPVGRTRPSHFKLSIAAYSYRDFLQGPNKSMDLFDFANLAADMGLDAIEPTGYYFPKDVDTAYLHRLRQHAFRLGLDISGTAIGNDFCVLPGPARDKQIADARLWIDRAAALCAPVIRIFSGAVPKGDSEDAAVERAVAAIEELLPYAAERGVSLALENHGGLTATPAGILRIVKAVKAPAGNFGVNFDSANFHTDDPYADLVEIAPYAINAQIKVEIARAGKPKEPADLARIVQILRDAKYSGYVALEYEAAEDPRTAIPAHIETLKPLLA